MNLTFVPNALEKISPTWVMSDITYPDGIITRTEDDYLRRIGSTFKGISFLGPGYPAWFEYSKDNLGASKSGFLHTSLVKELEIILDIGYAKLAITTEQGETVLPVTPNTKPIDNMPFIPTTTPWTAPPDMTCNSTGGTVHES